MIAQWEQDLASIQETRAVPALSCDGQSVRLTRRAEGGLQVVAWSLRPDSQRLVWQRWAGPPVTTTREPAGQLAAHAAVPGQRDRASCARSTGLEDWQVYFFQGNAWANCQSTGNVAPLPTAPASAGCGAARRARPLPDGVRLVLAFAPGSGLTGSLVRDIADRAMSRPPHRVDPAPASAAPRCSRR